MVQMLYRFRNLESSPLRKRELVVDEMLERFTPTESIKMAYVPLILTEAAFRFVDAVCAECASRKLPQHVKTVRALRGAVDGYHRETAQTVRHPETLRMLEMQVSSFFDEAGRDVQTLWYVVNQELKTRHPELDDYNLLTNVYVALALLEYVRGFERECDRMVCTRIGVPYKSTRPPHVRDAVAALEKLAGCYTLGGSHMLETAMRVIALKVDGMVVEIVED